MTPSSPDEALHFRGKTLTPESPRPLHIAEPANIPVLQNQMDPVFNDTSTYEKSGASYGDNFHVRNHSLLSSHGHYAGPGEMTGSTAFVQGPEQPQSQPHPQTQGSFYPGPPLVDDRLVDTNSTGPSIAPANVQSYLFSKSSTTPQMTAEPLDVQKATTDSFLTTSPPSDPVSLFAHPIPDVHPSSHTAHDIPFASEVNHSAASWTAQSVPRERLGPQVNPDDNNGEDGVDFQNLLDNLPPSSAAPPPAVVESISLSAEGNPVVPQAPADEVHQSSLSLPPRPPPQEKPSIHPNYNPSDDIRSYHQLPPHSSSTPNPYPTQHSNYQTNAGLPPLAAAGAPGTSSGASTLPPPPVASFQQHTSIPTETQEPPSSTAHKNNRGDRPIIRTSKPGDEDTPWGPEVQKKYDEFLHDERVYVTEGLWDRFPYGSRLFVGNLPTERVTKRDLFHIFHQYGKLAQISIKQAYGFIQFLEAPACKRALDAEQGAVVRGRKVHLEISKPQRNTVRSGAAPTEPSRAPPPRRSRSPEYSRSGPPSNRSSRAPADRYDRSYETGRVPFSDFRDEPSHRRRDDYRPPPRSPSPRAFRARDGYRSRDRTPERFDRRERRRSRSPYGRDRRYRSPSPRGRGQYESDLDLPVPRRAARDVPDVQILVLEELDRNYIYHVEDSFGSRGLRVDVLMLGPRIPLDAAVQRQISEGVLAVVRLSRPSQFSRKIPLQVFDRSGGVDNIRSNEYPDLDPNIAAEIVFQAQSMQRGGTHTSFTSTAFGVPPLPTAPLPHVPAPTLSNPPNLASAISSLDPSSLQSLLAALQQRPPAVPVTQQTFSVTNTPHATADLASLLGSATRQPLPPNLQQPFPPQPFQLQPPNPPLVSDPNLLSLLAKGLGTQQAQNQAAVPPHVQNIMSQLGKWKQ